MIRSQWLGLTAIRLTICVLYWLEFQQKLSTAALSVTDGSLSKANDNVNLGCQGVLSNEGSNGILWFKGQTQLFNSEKYQIVPGYYNSTLTVRLTGKDDVGIGLVLGGHAGKDDVGIYRCTQNDEYGLPQLLSKPVVTKLATSVTVIQGDNLNVICSAWGWPVPTVSWTQEGSLESFGVPSPSNGALVQVSLVITQAKPSDQKRYTCFTGNYLGSANSTTLVRVKDRLAAVWPVIGIILQVILIPCLIILGEFKKKRRQKLDKIEE